ncbi:regulator of Vps4 activity in the MVB pathway protein [Medicago truncatula]|uniref:Regulator of Vps4 activity in the MVB pathway protein n=1 Tax=Medicago truncatula TaxID=3880 RepID=A0A072U450_MEDTR|nr:regulator of Vps4 activity in the MVB pathway protein [Medicago truncatula]
MLFREVPPEVNDDIASLCYIGSWYNELPALKMVMSQFSLKYGEEYIDEVNKFKADCGVKEEVIELLLVPKPSIEKRNKLIKQIANRFVFNWDPISVINNASSAYEDPMSHIKIHSMLMLFNKIPCSNNKQFEISTCKSLLEKTIVDAQSLINTKEKKMDDMRDSIFQLLVYRYKIEAYTVVYPSTLASLYI